MRQWACDSIYSSASTQFVIRDSGQQYPVQPRCGTLYKDCRYHRLPGNTSSSEICVPLPNRRLIGLRLGLHARVDSKSSSPLIFLYSSLKNIELPVLASNRVAIRPGRPTLTGESSRLRNVQDRVATMTN